MTIPRVTCEFNAWEPIPIDPDSIALDRVTIDTPALRRAASMLGVALADWR